MLKEMLNKEKRFKNSQEILLEELTIKGKQWTFSACRIE